MGCTLAIALLAAAAAPSTDEALSSGPTLQAVVLDDSVPGGFPIELLRANLSTALAHYDAPEGMVIARLGRVAGEWVMELAFLIDDGARVATQLSVSQSGDVNALLNATWRWTDDLVAKARGEYVAQDTSLQRELGLATIGTLHAPLSLKAAHKRANEHSWVLPLAATGVAVAGVVVGALFHAVSQNNVQYRPIQPINHGGEPQRANTLAMAANVAFGVAGLAALTGGMLLVVDYREPSEATEEPTHASATLVLPF